MSITDWVVCKFAGCNQIYNDARILPCGKRTCAAHIDKMMVKFDGMECDRNMLKCHFCEEIHSFPENGKEFPVDDYIPLLLSRSYSGEHEAAKTSFNELTQLLDKLIKLDQEAYVNDYFERVEADILIEKEVNLQKLHAHYQKLVDEVHERKVKCLHNLKANKQFKSELDAIKQTLIGHESKLNRDIVNFQLKTHDGDVAKWKAIQCQCNTLLSTIRSSSEEINEKIVGDQRTKFVPNAHIERSCGRLSDTVVDSAILDNCEMQNDLIKLCNLSGKQFKLLYRATRDGFDAKSFHAKCDNQPNTLTMIKTTKEYVFGGYAAVACDSTSGWKIDPHAFIFSLINATNRPQLIPIKTDGQQGVCCDAAYGPTFGNYDISIASDSNVSTASFSDLGKSYAFALHPYATVGAQSFLAGSCDFQTAEIEVFRLS